MNASLAMDDKTAKVDQVWTGDGGIPAISFVRPEWAPCIVGSDLDVVARGELHPVDAGVYFLFNDDWELVYVGQSADIEKRLTQHRKGLAWAFHGATAVPGDLMSRIESAYIDALRPPLNQRGGRPATDDSQHTTMVEAIRARWALGVESA
jgi:hypothetical protein